MLTPSDASEDTHSSRRKGREFYLEGLSLGRDGRHDDALTSFSLALAVDPDLALAWVGRGFALGKLGRYEEEIECCDKAIQLDPHCIDAWNNKGGVLNRLGRHQEAIAFSRRVGNPAREPAVSSRLFFRQTGRDSGVSETR